MNLVQAIKAFLRDIRLFSKVVVSRELRGYQLAPARAIVDSVLHRRGLTFAVVMSRQAGKNELSAQLEAYLMNLYQQVRGACLVKASPTAGTQSQYSALRLRDCLANDWNAAFVRNSSNRVVQLGKCRCTFLSAHPSSNVVGATANVLLECDEAQAVDSAKWNKDFVPMGASTNVTTVFYGTMWTARTLLARVIRQLQAQEAKDGVQRVFWVPWSRVAQEVPAYGDYVRKEMARLGEQHPIVRTQYALQEIDEAGRLFTAERIARMKGQHPRQRQPCPGEVYALTVDVAGDGDDGTPESESRRDATAVTVVRVDLSALDDPLVGLPRYEVVDRARWVGRPHGELHGRLVELIARWDPAWVEVDATGVGAGLASFLAQQYGSSRDTPPGLVRRLVFGAASKSKLGWGFLSVLESGRFSDYVDDGAAHTIQFWREVEACEFEVLPGPGQRLRWGVPDPAVHDDLLISAAMVAELDQAEWSSAFDGHVVEAGDVLREVDGGAFA
jgi:hypothetical protein